MIEPLQPLETISSLGDEVASAKRENNPDELKELIEKIKEKNEYPDHEEILEVTEKGTSEEQKKLALSIVSGVIGSLDNIDINSFPKLEETDKGLCLNPDVDGAQVRVKFIMKDNRSAWERFRDKEPKLVYTGEVQLTVVTGNSDAPDENSVVVMTTKYDENGKIDLLSEKDKPLFMVTSEGRINDAYDRVKDEYRSIEGKFLRGAITREQLFQEVGGYKSFKDNQDAKNEIRMESRKLDPQEGRFKESLEDLNTRLIGLEYSSLQERAEEDLREIIKVTEENLRRNKEKKEKIRMAQANYFAKHGTKKAATKPEEGSVDQVVKQENPVVIEKELNSLMSDLFREVPDFLKDGEDAKHLVDIGSDPLDKGWARFLMQSDINNIRANIENIRLNIDKLKKTGKIKEAQGWEGFLEKYLNAQGLSDGKVGNGNVER